MKTIKLCAYINVMLMLAGFIALSGCKNTKWSHLTNTTNDSCQLALWRQREFDELKLFSPTANNSISIWRQRY